jgi:hypothetical protein
MKSKFEILVLFYLAILVSCLFSQESLSQSYQANINSNNRGAKKVILAREYCDYKFIDPCNDGTDNIVRGGGPLFIKLLSNNTDSLNMAYQDTMYQVTFTQEVQRALNLPPIEHLNYIDSLENIFDSNCNDYNKFKVYTPKRYNKKRKKGLNKDKIEDSYPGYYAYCLFEIEFEYFIDTEPRKIYTPYVDKNSFNGNQYQEKIIVYIIKVKSIKSVSSAFID